MEVAAAIIGVADVALRTSSKLWRLTAAWKEAPEKLHRLRDDITRTQEFFSEVRSYALEQRQRPSAAEKQTLGAPLIQPNLQLLLDQGATVLERIEAIVERLSGGDAGEAGPLQDLGKRRKIIWLRYDRAVAALRQDLSAVVSQVCHLMIAENVRISAETNALVKTWQRDLSSQLLQRIDEHHNALGVSLIASVRETVAEEVAWMTTNGHLIASIKKSSGKEMIFSQQTPSATGLGGAAWSSSIQRGAGFHDQAPSRYSGICDCPCHFTTTNVRWTAVSPRWALGAIGIMYTSRGSAQEVCERMSCRDHQGRQRFRNLRFAYQFPTWLVRATLSVFLSSNLNGSPQMNIRVSNQLKAEELPDENNLWTRITRNDAQGAKQMLMEGRASVHDVWLPDCFGPLWVALVGGRPDMVKVLLEAGADPFYVVPRYGRSAISLAFVHSMSASASRQEAAALFPIEEFLESAGFSTIHLAVWGGLHLDLAAALCQPKYQLQVNAKCAYGRTPLHIAAMRGDANAVRVLIDAGAQVDALDEASETALLLALRNSHLRPARVLVEAGADPRSKGKTARTALHLLSGLKEDVEGIRSLVSLLVLRGADINALGLDHDTPLHAAARYGNPHTIESLLDNGADIKCRDIDGLTPLTTALWYQPSDPSSVFKLLLRAGADVQALCIAGSNILHWIARYAVAETMEIFAAARMKGVDKNLVAKGPEDGSTSDFKFFLNKTPQQVLDARNPSPEIWRAFSNLLASLDEKALVHEANEGNCAASGEVYVDADTDDEFFDAREGQETDTTTGLGCSWMHGIGTVLDEKV